MAKKSEAQIRAEEEQKRKAEVGKAVLLIPWILIGTTTLFAVALMVNGYWWGIVDSNHGPRSYQDRALTT